MVEEVEWKNNHRTSASDYDRVTGMGLALPQITTIHLDNIYEKLL